MRRKSEEPAHPFAGDRRESWLDGPAVEIKSRPDGTYVFGAFGDLHAGSKYARFDVREDLVRQAERAGAQAIFDTGNWIDGDARFNRHSVEVSGLDEQLRLLARKHPRTRLPIFAVSGDDHEGWYAQREGIDVGRYCESIMREAGHDWTDLGYMESHVTLRHAKSGACATLAVVHPGGGSAYAISYRPQKIVETLEGGEKPAVLLIGHYHKLECVHVRNVWVLQCGTQQDQTPFMRKKAIEAHVGGAVVELTQDPKTGGIVGCRPDLRRYYYAAGAKAARRWTHHGPVAQPRRVVGGRR